MQKVSYDLNLKHGLGCLSLNPLSAEQFLGLEAKFQGITENFRCDAITLYYAKISL